MTIIAAILKRPVIEKMLAKQLHTVTLPEALYDLLIAEGPATRLDLAS